MSAEQVNEQSPYLHLWRTCESNPDLGLDLIKQAGKDAPEFELDPTIRLCKARAYQVKGLRWAMDRPWLDVGALYSNEIRLYTSDEDLNCLEFALAENKQIEGADPGVLEILGEDWTKQMNVVSYVVERCRPGRVQMILGKTRLSYFDADRIRLLPYLKKELPSEKLSPFLNVWVNHSEIAKAVLVLGAGEDSRRRRFIKCMLLRKTFDEFGIDETHRHAEIGFICLYDDGTSARTTLYGKCE